jgi:cytochrome c-type biogenesis protein CcmE
MTRKSFGRSKMASSKWKFILGGAVIVAALAWLGFIGIQESKSYYITVQEYFDMQGAVHGKTLKVAGDVVEGSIDRSKSPMEFVIRDRDKSLRVKYVGHDVIPDTFKDGSKAVVEGTVAGDGTFQARHIEAKCASKYEAEYEKRNK